MAKKEMLEGQIYYVPYIWCKLVNFSFTTDTT